MAEETITKPSNSADPQSDLLAQFLNEPSPGDAQKQMKEAGGVPLESQSTDPEPGEQSSEQPVETPKSVRTVSSDPEVPSDILKKQNIQVEDDTPTQEVELDEQVPQEVSQRGKKGVDAWTAAKREAKQFKQQVEELQSKLQSIESETQSNAELEELKKKYEQSEKARQQVEERLGQVDIVYSNEFKNTYDKPIANSYNKSIKILMQAGVDQKSAKALVSRTMTPTNTQDQIMDLVQDFPPAIQGALYQNALEMIEGQKRRNDAIKNWKSTKAALSEEEKRSAEVRMKEIISQNVDSAIETVRNEGSWLYTRSESDEKWNESVAERVEAVKGLMKSATPDVLAKYVAEGLVSQSYRKLYEKQLVESRKLKKELSARERVRPGLGGASFPDDSGPDKSKPLKGDDWLDKTLRN